MKVFGSILMVSPYTICYAAFAHEHGIWIGLLAAVMLGLAMFVSYTGYKLSEG